MELKQPVIDQLAAEAVELIGLEHRSPLLLLCEHAGATIPEPWEGLGLDPVYLTTHFAYDIGAGDLTRDLARALCAPAVLSTYSRIFLDYNRTTAHWDRMRTDLGGIPVPGNLTISDKERALRDAVADEPMSRAIAPLVQTCAAVVSIHSFTPVMGSHVRDVDVGLLWREDSPFVRRAAAEMMRRAPDLGLRVAENEPYDWRQDAGYSLEAHALDHGLPCFYIEVNNAAFSNIETRTAISELLTGTFEALCQSEPEWAAPNARKGWTQSSRTANFQHNE